MDKENAKLVTEEMLGLIKDLPRAKKQETPLPMNVLEIEVDGVLRPALNSEGRPIHWSIEGITNFWRWFRNSQVVDEHGRPRVMYHGTVVWERNGKQLGDIEVFDRNASVNIVGRPPSADTVGCWFSSNPDSKNGAGMYSGPNGAIYPVYLSIQDSKRTTFKAFTRTAFRYAHGEPIDSGPANPTNMEPYRELLKEQGYDGVTFIHDVDRESTEFKEQTVYVTLNEWQVKSAISNTGTFDPQSATILGQPFYSALRRGIERANTKTAYAQGWTELVQGMLNKGDVKADEVEWSGVREWLAMQDGKIEKARVVEYLAQNGVSIEEVLIGGLAEDVDKIDARQRVINQWEPKIREAREKIADAVKSGSIVSETIARQALKALIGACDEEVNAVAGTREKNREQVKYEKYTLPGGREYKELLLKLPLRLKPWGAAIQEAELKQDKEMLLLLRRAQLLAERRGRGISIENSTSNLLNAARQPSPIDPLPENDAGEFLSFEALHRTKQLMEVGEEGENNFTSHHWNHKNVVAHIRFNERTARDGRRVMFVEEIQGDWGQLGKKKGMVGPETTISGKTAHQWQNEANEIVNSYKGKDWDASPEKRKFQVAATNARELREKYKKLGITGEVEIPSGPFVSKTSAWLGLAAKRIVSYAAENGFDAVAFINGKQSASRYEMFRHADLIQYRKSEDETYRIIAYKNGRVQGSLDGTVVEASDLPAVVGQELAEKMSLGEGKQLAGTAYRAIGGIDINLADSRARGMLEFYDSIVPRAINAMVKKLGGEGTEPIEIVNFEDTSPEMTSMHQIGFTISPAIREKALQGLPLFQTNGEAKRGCIAFDDQRRFDISILPGADKSTFLHEAAHLYLEVLADLASFETASKEIKQDFQDVLEYLGLESRDQITLAGKIKGSAEYLKAEAAHEKFARANEAYLMDGSAVSPSLQPMFNRFRDWLREIYRDLSPEPSLDPKIRRVLDSIYHGCQQGEPSQVGRQSAEEIRQDIEPKLRRAGFQDDVSASYAQVFSNALGNLATRAGFSAGAVYHRYQVNIENQSLGNYAPGDETLQRRKATPR